MKKITISLFAGIVIVLSIQANIALACDCGASSPIQNRFEQSDAIFSGQVTQVKYLEDKKKIREPRTIVTITVLQSWKGVTEPTVEIQTTENAYSCSGYRFKKGDQYLVFGYTQADGSLTTGLCSGTHHLDNATEDIDWLNNPVFVDDPSYSMETGLKSYAKTELVSTNRTVIMWVVLAAGVTILLVVIFIVLRKYRKKNNDANTTHLS